MSTIIGCDDHAVRVRSTVTKIWTELLHCQEVGLEDDFFECGGDSIEMMMLLFAVERALQIKVPPATFLQHPTLGDFCEVLSREYGPEQQNDSSTWSGTI